MTDTSIPNSLPKKQPATYVYVVQKAYYASTLNAIHSVYTNLAHAKQALVDDLHRLDADVTVKWVRYVRGYRVVHVLYFEWQRDVDTNSNIHGQVTRVPLLGAMSYLRSKPTNGGTHD